MAGLNAILAKIYSSPMPPGAAAGGFQTAPQQGSADSEQDLFQAGRYWLNRAGAEKGAPAGTGCRCGSCAACAARAYSSQGKGLSAPLTAAGEQEETGAAATEEADGGQGQGEDKQAAAAAGSSRPLGRDGEPLELAEMARLAELKKADTAVRAHEQAHLAAAGGLAMGGASFSYERGPDGRNYAVAGEVQIDTSEGATPEETLAKMMQVRAAALAPANPSPQDRKVAQAASLTMAEARQEINMAGLGTKAQQEEAAQGAAAEDEKDGGTGQNASAATAARRSSAVAARAASRYQAIATGQGPFHLAV